MELTDEPASQKDNDTPNIINSLPKLILFSEWTSVIITIVSYVFVGLPLLILFYPWLQKIPYGIGWLFIVGIGVLPPLSVIYNIWVLKRRNWTATQVEQASSRDKQTHFSEQITKLAGEPTIELALPGISHLGINSYGFPGWDTEIQHPENTLLVTNHALCFIYVPMPGGDNQMTDVSIFQSLFNQKGIRSKLQSLLSSQPVSKILTMDHRNWIVPFDEIIKLKFSEWRKAIIVTKANGERRTYGLAGLGWSRRSDWNKLKQVLTSKNIIERAVTSKNVVPPQNASPAPRNGAAIRTASVWLVFGLICISCGMLWYYLAQIPKSYLETSGQVTNVKVTNSSNRTYAEATIYFIVNNQPYQFTSGVSLVGDNPTVGVGDTVTVAYDPASPGTNPRNKSEIQRGYFVPFLSGGIGLLIVIICIVVIGKASRRKY